jgi:hypothetical protein
MSHTADELSIVLTEGGHIVSRRVVADRVEAHVDLDARYVAEDRRARLDALLAEAIQGARHEGDEACDVAVLGALARAGVVVRLVPFGVQAKWAERVRASLGGASGLGRV